MRPEKYEKFLTLGEYLTDEERHELYQYLLSTKRNEYSKLFDELIQKGTAVEEIANSEIKFKYTKGILSNSVREIGSNNFQDGYRKIRIIPLNLIGGNRAAKFFAQCEVDAIRNFPLPGLNKKTHFDYGINHYPYYELNYYSNGRGKILGLLAKMKAN